jgi:hypothetical protein
MINQDLSSDSVLLITDHINSVHYRDKEITGVLIDSEGTIVVLEGIVPNDLIRGLLEAISRRRDSHVNQVTTPTP